MLLMKCTKRFTYKFAYGGIVYNNRLRKLRFLQRKVR